MNTSGFTDKQKKALLDLLVLGMYADSHLARVEEARIQKLLDSFEFPSDHSRNQFFDAGVSRVNRQGTSAEAIRNIVRDLAREFTSPDLCRRAVDALDQLLASDSAVTDRERDFLADVRNAFGC